ncbi:MAG: hypothetical protein ACI85F_000632 [Bacteroidia bacterium]|jgi:hypothetical protein
MKTLSTLDKDQAKRLSRDLLESGKTIKLKLDGRSMFPSILPGDVATVHKVDASELKLGQVVVFEISNSWIAHRIVGLKKINGQTVIRTQGDAITKLDDDMGIDSILGLVITVERSGVLVKTNRLASWFYVRLRPFPQIASTYAWVVRKKLLALFASP